MWKQLCARPLWFRGHSSIAGPAHAGQARLSERSPCVSETTVDIPYPPVYKTRLLVPKLGVCVGGYEIGRSFEQDQFQQGGTKLDKLFKLKSNFNSIPFQSVLQMAGWDHITQPSLLPLQGRFALQFSKLLLAAQETAQVQAVSACTHGWV